MVLVFSSASGDKEHSGSQEEQGDRFGDASFANPGVAVIGGGAEVNEFVSYRIAVVVDADAEFVR